MLQNKLQVFCCPFCRNFRESAFSSDIQINVFKLYSLDPKYRPGFSKLFSCKTAAKKHHTWFRTSVNPVFIVNKVSLGLRLDIKVYIEDTSLCANLYRLCSVKKKKKPSDDANTQRKKTIHWLIKVINYPNQIFLTKPNTRLL